MVSQFTLLGDCRKGKRPGLPGQQNLKQQSGCIRILLKCAEQKYNAEEGTFRAEMMVHIENDGPVTLILDSRKLF